MDHGDEMDVDEEDTADGRSVRIYFLIMYILFHFQF